MTTPDITDRLRSTPRSDIRELMNEAAAEIERLRGYRDEAEAEASIASLAAQRLRLTDAEREAVAFAARRMLDAYVEEREVALTLRGLLERCTKNGAAR